MKKGLGRVYQTDSMKINKDIAQPQNLIFINNLYRTPL